MYAKHLRHAIFLAGLLAMTRAARADADLLPADRALPDVIDHYIEQRLTGAKVSPTAPADALPRAASAPSWRAAGRRGGKVSGGAVGEPVAPGGDGEV